MFYVLLYLVCNQCFFNEAEEGNRHLCFYGTDESENRKNVYVGNDFNSNWEIVNRAIDLGAQKVQFFKPYFNQEMIDKAHKHGIICNVFWSDDVSEAKEFLKMGMDTVLTNDYNLVSKAIEE